MTEAIEIGTTIEDGSDFARCTGFYRGVPTWDIWRAWPGATTVVGLCAPVEDIRAQLADPNWAERQEITAEMRAQDARTRAANGRGG